MVKIVLGGQRSRVQLRIWGGGGIHMYFLKVSRIFQEYFHFFPFILGLL